MRANIGLISSEIFNRCGKSRYSEYIFRAGTKSVLLTSAEYYGNDGFSLYSRAKSAPAPLGPPILCALTVTISAEEKSDFGSLIYP